MNISDGFGGDPEIIEDFKYAENEFGNENNKNEKDKEQEHVQEQIIDAVKIIYIILF
jgi:hypothetical protein